MEEAWRGEEMLSSGVNRASQVPEGDDTPLAPRARGRHTLPVEEPSGRKPTGKLRRQPRLRLPMPPNSGNLQANPGHPPAQHLDAYLDEQCFRFNERKGSDGSRFRQVLRCVFAKRLSYAELTS